jgi:xanthine dehydrogenase YagS FAD-binding subunit
MNPFTYVNARSFKEASELLTAGRFKLPVLKAGGLDVVDHLKEGLVQADALINIRRLTVDDKPNISAASGRIRINATTTLAELAASPILWKQAPVIAQAVHSAATPQARNIATAAGNLLQRPRCWYYRHEQFHCLKKGGDRCFALEGENKYHAIFGGGPCHIVHPSNLAPALSVCDATVYVTGGTREMLPIADLFHMPARGIMDEHNLTPGEVVTHIALRDRPSSGFYAIKEKQSFDWPLVVACVALDLNGETITSARVCAGAVAPVPWRLDKVEKALAGVKTTDDEGIRAAANLSGEGASPMRDNGYKVKLLAAAVRRAIVRAAGRDPEPKA